MNHFMTNLYSYDYEEKAETDEDDVAEIYFMIANEGLDGDKEEDTEVIKPKAKRKPPKYLWIIRIRLWWQWSGWTNS